jgi:UDP:flavonoid glycosyltransferase YjiC (YdhE family)
VRAVQHLLFVTLGSLGDLHPMLGLAVEWQRRGGRATLATSAFHRERVERAGVGFTPLRPEFDPTDPELLRQVLDLRFGMVRLLRDLTFPHVREQHEDLLTFHDRCAEEGEPLAGIVASELAFAAPILAEERGLPWAAVVLQPMAFVSAHDPPVVPLFPVLSRMRWLGPRITDALIRTTERVALRWARPVRELRRELGLPDEGSRITRGKEHADLALALFSPVLGARQPDWPERTVHCGYPFFREPGSGQLSGGLEAFLGAGPPPVVFTLGSAAVFQPGVYYTEALQAARRLGVRAVLMVGEEDRSGLPATLPEGIHAEPYAPFGDLFPRAAAVVHAGGVGTTGEALRAGVPQLVVPWSQDQPDNAARVRRLGVARVLPRNRFRAEAAVRELRALLADGALRDRAAEVARTVSAERGAEVACGALEERLRG